MLVQNGPLSRGWSDEVGVVGSRSFSVSDFNVHLSVSITVKTNIIALLSSVNSELSSDKLLNLQVILGTHKHKWLFWVHRTTTPHR